MGTSTLHLNNPVPSNGAVAASLGGRHTVTATLSGVGAISCKVQAWASVDGTDSRMIGAPVVISGTTTVSQTLTFNALDVTQFWLAVVEITPACTFTATVENSGDVQFGGAVLAPAKPNSAPRRGFGTYWINLDTLPANQTAVMRLQAPFGVVGAHFYIGHYGADPADITKAGVRAAGSSTEDTATTAFSPVKFGGADGGVVPGWILGKYPAGDKSAVQFLKSDYVALTPIARTDFPTREPLFDFAFKCGARGVSGGSFSPTDNGNTPWVLGWTNTASDIIANPSATSMYPYMGNRVWVEWVYSGSRRPVLGAWGDSIFDGMSASNIVDGYLQNSTFAANIELYSNSIGGRTSFDTWDAMRMELPKIASKLDAVVLAAWTPNDEINGYSAYSVWQRFLAEKSWVESLGLRCVIVGPVPFIGSATPAIIRGYLIAAGVDFFDAGILMATSSTLLTWKASRSSDNIHPNDVGYAELTIGFRQHLSIRVGFQHRGRVGVESYAAYESLPMFDNNVGDRLLVRGLSGTNVAASIGFLVEWTGARWAVVPGSPVVADNTETSYTSVGTTLTAIKSVVIPAGVIGDGELWEVSEQDTQISGANDATGTHKITLGGIEIWSNTGAITSTPYSFDVVPRRIRRAGSVFKRYTSGLSDSMAVDEINCAANLANSQTLTFSVVPAAIGNVYRVRRLYLNRVS